MIILFTFDDRMVLVIPAMLLLLIDKVQVAAPPEFWMLVKIPVLVAVNVYPLMLLLLILITSVTAPVLLISNCVPVAALVELFEMVLFTMLSVAGVAEVRIAVNKAEVAPV